MEDTQRSRLRCGTNLVAQFDRNGQGSRQRVLVICSAAYLCSGTLRAFAYEGLEQPNTAVTRFDRLGTCLTGRGERPPAGRSCVR